MYILKLKEKYKLAQTTVDGILSDTEQIAWRIVSQLQQRVVTILNEAGVDPKKIPGFLEVFEGPEILRPFNGLNTEYLQHKYFRENMGLVVSVLTPLGTDTYPAQVDHCLCYKNVTINDMNQAILLIIQEHFIHNPITIIFALCLYYLRETFAS